MQIASVARMRKIQVKAGLGWVQLLLVTVLSTQAVLGHETANDAASDPCEFDIEPLNPEAVHVDPAKEHADRLAIALARLDACLAQQKSETEDSIENAKTVGQTAAASGSSQTTSSTTESTTEDEEESTEQEPQTLNRITNPRDRLSIQPKQDLASRVTDGSLVLDDYGKVLYEAYEGETDPHLKQALLDELNAYVDGMGAAR